MIKLVQNGVQFQGKLQLSNRIWELDKQDNVFGIVANPIFELNNLDSFVSLFFNVLFEQLYGCLDLFNGVKFALSSH